MKKIRIGIFGAGVRGLTLAANLMLLNCDIVAFCEMRPDQREVAKQQLGADVAAYECFDEFIEHDMDAVILTNFFHEHAPYAIRCFEKGLHVFSECISNGTMADGVALIRAFEKSNSVYMLGENYPQMLFNREIKRVCDGGTLGRVMYAEGEYNHPSDPWDFSFKKDYIYREDHWRNFLPATYYVTHSLGPIMWATGATPKRVTALPIYQPPKEDIPYSKATDRTAILMTLNDDDSVFRMTGCASFGGHHNSYRVCGQKGTIENLRGMGEQVMLRYNRWQLPEGAEEISLYTPKWNDPEEEFIKQSGHGGGDYLTMRMFLECVRENRQPEHPFDIHSAVAMSSVAILGHRSVLENGTPYDIPDFHEEEWRVRYENDTLSPFYGTDGSQPTIPGCSHPDYRPTERQIELYKQGLGL